MSPVSRRAFLAAGGTVGLSAAAAATPAGAAAAPPHTGATPDGAVATPGGTAPAPDGVGLDAALRVAGDRTFTGQSVVQDTASGVELSTGLSPAAGRVWVVRRVFWNVNYDGNVADRVQTYLYRLPGTLTTAQAHAHMGSSLEGWLGCCGNAGLTGNGDMQIDDGDVLVRPGQQLWIWFIVPAVYDNWVTAAGMSVWDRPG